MKGRKRYLSILGFIIALVVIFSQCADQGQKNKGSREYAYAGSTSCKQCHARVSGSYAHNAHFKTSGMLSGKDWMSNLQGGSARYSFGSNANVSVEWRNNGWYQIGSSDGKQIRAERFDVAFGSGTRAQTFGYWKGNKLYQLPLSYFRSAHSWANSPGYSQQGFYFDRLIISRCMECHTSYIDKTFVKTGGLAVEEAFDKKTAIYGIDCERCHGPAADHVEFHLKSPAEKAPKHIAAFSSLSRKARVDQCGICHSGSSLEAQRSAFEFKPGDTLSNYLYMGLGSASVTEPDVHGNQRQLMLASKCYMKSAVLECSTCHSTHASVKPGIVSYSVKCISCHAVVQHDKSTLIAAKTLKTNCIDCHMPLQPSKVITVQRAGQPKAAPYLLRNHRIAIYSNVVNSAKGNEAY